VKRHVRVPATGRAAVATASCRVMTWTTCPGDVNAPASRARSCGGANRGRVGERACRRDLESRGDRETDVEIAEFEIELARAQEGQCVSAVHVVVHRQARVPLAELVKARAHAPHAAAAIGRIGKSTRCRT